MKQWWNIMFVLLDTSIRVAELSSLTVLGVQEGYLMIVGEGREECKVGISLTAAKFPWKYVNLHSVAEDETVESLLTNFAGRLLLTCGVTRRMHEAATVAAIEDISVAAHHLRHTFARTWLEQGG